MNISVDDLQHEAGQLALENRFKDRIINGLQAEVERLRKQVDELTPKDEPEGDKADPGPAGPAGKPVAEASADELDEDRERRLAVPE